MHADPMLDGSYAGRGLEGGFEMGFAIAEEGGRQRLMRADSSRKSLKERVGGTG